MISRDEFITRARELADSFRAAVQNLPEGAHRDDVQAAYETDALQLILGDVAPEPDIGVRLSLATLHELIANVPSEYYTLLRVRDGRRERWARVYPYASVQALATDSEAGLMPHPGSTIQATKPERGVATTPTTLMAMLRCWPSCRMRNPTSAPRDEENGHGQRQGVERPHPRRTQRGLRGAR
ncbi:hypothetical protein [Streptomyces griseorubiginosus]|uniref:hypothetical protein n=1 Tax=Streptomyces griseorubiginosus TaxID=67304 RepID=UPI0036EB29BE